LTSLVKKLDERLAATTGKTQNPLGVYVIFDNPGIMENAVRKVAEYERIQNVTLSIGAVPAKYEINPIADITVVIYEAARRGQPVTANFALRTSELTPAKADEIVAALSNVLPK
jgi:hypothetical protein